MPQIKLWRKTIEHQTQHYHPNISQPSILNPSRHHPPAKFQPQTRQGPTFSVLVAWQLPWVMGSRTSRHPWQNNLAHSRLGADGRGALQTCGAKPLQQVFLSLSSFRASHSGNFDREELIIGWQLSRPLQIVCLGYLKCDDKAMNN